MSGLELKQFLLSQGLTLADVRKRLNITSQLIDGLLKVNDVKSGFLERIAKVYDKDIRWFYGLDKESCTSEPTENEKCLQETVADLRASLKVKDEQISSLIKLLEKVNS